MPKNTTATPYNFVHRWPWRTEEFVSMALVFGVCTGSGYLTHNLIWMIVGLVLGIAGVAALYRTKITRVTRSQVLVTIKGNVVSVVSKSALGMSRADLSRVAGFDARQFGADETFIISDGSSSVRIPLRTTKDPEVARIVTEAFNRAENIATEGRELFEKMTDGNIPG